MKFFAVILVLSTISLKAQVIDIRRISDINPDSKDSYVKDSHPSDFLAVDSVLYFAASETDFGNELYRLEMKRESQKYFPFPSENVNWNIRLIAGCDNDLPPDTTILRYTIHGDTTINDISYMKLCLETGDTLEPIINPIGGIRESERKIYFIGKDYLGIQQEQEVLLYDFTASIGDTVVHDEYNEFFSVVETIDSVLIGSDYRKRYHLYNQPFFHNPDYVVEGIGSVKKGLLGHITNIPTCGQHYWEHICFREDNIVKYLNPSFGDCFPNDPFVPARNFIHEYDITIYPNPIDEELVIENNSGISISALKITDMGGRIILEKGLVGKKSVIPFKCNPGFYNVMIIDNTGQVIKIKKIIKTWDF